MRTLAIGDIHGCYRALKCLANCVPFRDDDLLITLGDYVDRGPNSKSVLEWVMERTQAGQCIPLRGNHEAMMMAAIRGEMPLQHWLYCGGDKALASYGRSGRQPNVEDIPEEHIQFLEHSLHRAYETSGHIFVHASLLPDEPVLEQPDDVLYWERFDWIAPHESGKTIICGHTAQHSGVPANVGHAICIDTWVYGRGWLTCLDVETGQYWQADEHGLIRSDWLDLSQTPV